jgi:hypothetical protein
MPKGIVEKQPDRAAVWISQEAEAVGSSGVTSFNSRAELCTLRSKHIHFPLHHTSGCTFLMRK